MIAIRNNHRRMNDEFHIEIDAGRLRYTCTVRGDAEIPVRVCIKQGREELFAGTCEAGEELSAELELQTALRDRIDLIVKASGVSRANVTMLPEIEMCGE
jgi:hypothetical protein